MRVLVLLVSGLLVACSASAPGASRSTGRQPAAATAGTTAVATAANPAKGDSNPAPGLIVPTTIPSQMSSTAGTGGALSMASVPNGPIAIDQTGADNPAGLSVADVQKLVAGGAPGSARILYPYDGTVFPRGLLPPTVMWEGTNADAVYVHMHAQNFDYKAVLKPTIDPTSMAPQLTIPEDVWTKAGFKTGGKSDPFSLELSVRAGGTVSGPMRMQFTIAQATVKGSIYYNTYASKLPGAAGGGNVLRIPAGGKVQLFMSMTCNGCHSVSADGSKMLSQIELINGGNAFSLTSGGAANPQGAPAGPRVSFGALYPDGSKYLSTSTAVSLAHAELAQPPGTAAAATLFDTTTGQAIPDTGIPEGAVMPMFSPDGKHLVFNDFAIDSADGLAVMDYDVTTNKAANYKELMRDADATRPGWPFFLPDSKGVVFTRTVSPDFSGLGAYVGIGGAIGAALPIGNLASLPVAGPASDLYIADIASGKVTLLAKAMGYDKPEDLAGEKTNLPFKDDVHQNYFPTVAPIAAGGYFWVFFDSIRHYGNLGIQRQLYGVAVDIAADGTYTSDPSHPAFYLPGQEFGAGNHRAFAALDPCKKDGDSCTSGIDCCGGTCFFGETPAELVEPKGSCSPPPVNSCAKRDERCKHDADCCLPENGLPPNSCIAGFCAFVSPG